MRLCHRLAAGCGAQGAAAPSSFTILIIGTQEATPVERRYRGGTCRGLWQLAGSAGTFSCTDVLGS